MGDQWTNHDAKTGDSKQWAAARVIAYNFLARRDYAVAELRERLLRRGVEPDVAEGVLSELHDAGYVNDARFAKAWIETRGPGRGMGRRRLRLELRQKGIADEIGAEALEAYDAASELEAARDAAARRVRSYPPAKTPEERRRQQQRLGQFLQRRGFDWEITRTVVDELI